MSSTVDLINRFLSKYYIVGLNLRQNLLRLMALKRSLNTLFANASSKV